jgi:hypothetical protein
MRCTCSCSSVYFFERGISSIEGITFSTAAIGLNIDVDKDHDIDCQSNYSLSIGTHHKLHLSKVQCFLATCSSDAGTQDLNDVLVYANANVGIEEVTRTSL